jgi:hypothetical protein
VMPVETAAIAIERNAPLGAECDRQGHTSALINVSDRPQSDM